MSSSKTFQIESANPTGNPRQPPQQAPDDLVIFGDERRRMLYQFNETAMAYPEDALIHELFEAQVVRTPGAFALLHGGQALSYFELNCQANQVARYLARNGVGPGRLVGVHLERGPQFVAVLLGILKAGGVYLPLDPTYPRERLAYVISDAAPGLVLTQERLCNSVRAPAAEVFVWEEIRPAITREEDANLDRRLLEVTARSLAYVIYTSGSTGEPKGVAAEHRGTVNRILAQEHIAPFVPNDVCCQKTSIGFVDAVFETLGPLACGRPLVIAPEAVARDPIRLAALVHSEGVTRLITVPSLAQAFLTSERVVTSLQGLRHWTLSGEELQENLAVRLKRALPNCGFINLYGSSEVAADATYFDLRDYRGGRVPIGRPIPNTRIYILDPNQNPVPIGKAGEIYVGGVGVARGYLKRPHLTAQRFLSDPFSAATEALMYRTGDLGRWRPDGAIEYLGRNDHQVKIRGLRIELGEIEAQLIRHGEVKEAVVVAREDVPGEKRLVAYVIPAAVGQSPSAEALREHLKGVLPEYMIPSAFAVLERFPLTPSGKLDRRALPAPELSAYASRQYEAPLGEVEEILVGIWQSLLRVERVGRNDNFFELGGHSLLIVQMRERLRRVGLAAEVRQVFESPTLADLAAALTRDAVSQIEVPRNRIPAGCEAITPEMLPLIELEPGHIERIVETVPGGAANVQDIYPLAPLQEGMLFHHVLEERGDTYVLSIALSVCSRERLEEFTAALQAVIDRHDILRTAVLWEGLPRPVQVVYRQARLLVEEVALEPDRGREEQIRDWLRRERQRLDLRQAPLMRLQIAADPHSARYYALLQMHHITSDHVTIEIVFSEVMAHLQGRVQRLPQSMPYREHVAQVLAYARAHDAQAFFRGKLSEVEESTAPFGLLDVYGDGSQIEEAREELDASLAQRLRTQARRLSVSAATLFHAAWALVVARTSGREDVVYGTVLLGRLQGSAGAQRVLGVFINTLPLKLSLQGVTAKQLVEQTQRELVELLAHEQASLAEAQRCSGVRGSAPLFTTLFNYRHSAPNSEEAQWDSASGVEVLAGEERTNYPVTFSVDDLGEGFAFVAHTDRRIDPQRMVQYLRTAVQSLVQALEEACKTPVLALPVLPERERQQVIELFNATQAPYPKERLIQELFEQQVRRTPEATAVQHEGRHLTYAKLNSRANQLARYLVNRRVGPGEVVGICVQRSLEMVVGLLGILKAGGAYLPLDPNYPTERLQHMLDDAAPRVVLTETESMRALPRTQAEVIALDEKLLEISGHLEEDLRASDLGLTPQSLVYVIYTSGSTGKPKGIAMRHCSMVNLMDWHRRTFDTTEGERILQFAALSFDVAFQEIFSTLCTGGTLVLLDEWLRKDPKALTELMSSCSIQRLFVPPLMLQGLAEYATAAELIPSSLRDVVAAGEQLRISPEIRAFFRQVAGCRLHNHYGPTETHVVTALSLSGDPDEWPDLPAIGRPTTNAQIYILDKHLQPVPIGVAGEIYIGGAGVARGYLNRPELTAERFLSDPFSNNPQARMYKTGDVGRWRPDGVIEYLGRNDHQVKIRGFRIELGEIEAQLTRHSEVKEAVVLAREDVPREKRLVAYVIPAVVGQSSNVEVLREYLKKALPEYMVPSAFVMLERFPLTPNGKLDRRALPAPDLSAYVSRQYEPPLGEVEEILAAIWQSLLKVEQIGRNDNFFELGGHSLLGMKLTGSIKEHFGVALGVSAVFRYPSVSEIASVVSSVWRPDAGATNSSEDEFVEGVIPLSSEGLAYGMGNSSGTLEPPN